MIKYRILCYILITNEPTGIGQGVEKITHGRLKKPFDLQYGENIYMVKNSPGKYNIHIGKGFTTDGELHELESPEYNRPFSPSNLAIILERI